MGRPRTVSLEPEEMVALGKEMVEWVKSNKPIHLKQWYGIEKDFVRKQWRTMKECPEFLPYYEKALNIISINYIDGEINPSIAQRFLRIYFDDLRDQEDQDAKDKVERESKALTDIPPLSSLIDIQNENMMLRAEIEKLKAK